MPHPAIWASADGLGSVLGEVDPFGNLTASRKYDVYGLVRAVESGTSRHKFVGSLGHAGKDETGLVYMRRTDGRSVIRPVQPDAPILAGAGHFCVGGTGDRPRH